MELEDVNKYETLDSQGLMGRIQQMPGQLYEGWELGQSLPLQPGGDLRSIILAGMGDSAAGPELLAAYAAPACPLPVVVLREDSLPAWARGRETLVIACSHSGLTEETLAVFNQAQARGCRLMVIGAGGRLAEQAQAASVPVWLYPSGVHQRTAAAYVFGLLLAAFHRLDLLPDPVEELHETMHAMRNQQTNLHPQVPVVLNPAKREAGQMVGRMVTVFGAEGLVPVARRWKSQICVNAKAWSQFDVLPEAGHSTLAGLDNPESALIHSMAIFLSAPSLSPRSQRRLELTRQAFMMQGINTDWFTAKGETRMAHLWTLTHFGDYTSYYLAMAYGVDPTPVELIDALKAELGRSSEHN